MWLISLVKQNVEQMQRMGLQLSAEDIYSINSSSLKDAVVMLDDGGCSAEIISPYGLVLTNHHCAVSDIQYHSTASNNLLHDGFWATSHSQELPIPGKTALILQRVEDVTQRILTEVDYNAPDYFLRVQELGERVSAEVEKREKGTYAMVVPMYSYNRFYLFVYHRFTDVRLVGAPPSSIGNFGGDVDNWRWPRHTGDFALYRIYTSPNGKPAEYSKRNVPYKPRHYFPISLTGVGEDDFTMVVGYPGSTYRHSTSYHALNERDEVAPWVDEVWGSFIASIKEAMQADPEAKVLLTDKHDMLVNFWQKDTYQAQSMHRFDVVSRLKAREDSLLAWGKNNQHEIDYARVLSDIESYYSKLGDKSYEPIFRSLGSLVHWPVEVGSIIYELYDLIMELVADKPSKRKIRREVKRVRTELPELFKSFNAEVDKKLYSAALISLLRHLPESYDNPILNELMKNDYPEMLMPIVVDYFYERSYFSSPESLSKFLDNPVADSLYSDPLFMLHISYESQLAEIYDELEPLSDYLQRAMRDYTKGLLSMNPEKLHYPDANSTMRFSYGKVVGYTPRDGMRFNTHTYLKGKFEKENPEVEVFRISPLEKMLWEAASFGAYADSVGVPICFITDNDITNGNSGSPVLNAQGHLVGVAFDGNYEAMACDFMYEPHMQRTIVTDIRYVLFVIDKFANAQWLIDEMTIVE
ncbi:MAG: S46 family peptidase [Tenuifilaceae bacterium]|nr:S46 family peptidase [Tenuifilaceae bacterium]